MNTFARWKPSVRFVTQNLLVSAAAALEPDRYVSDEEVEDLATVISLTCLYDRLVVVGPHHLIDVDNRLFSYLRENILSTRELSEGDWKRSVDCAESYAAAFLRTPRLAGTNEFFSEIYRMSRRYGLEGELYPDGPRDVDYGRSLLEDVKGTEELRKFITRGRDGIVVAYVLRTFLYVAFSDRLGIPLAADAARQPLLQHLADDSQERFREAILSVVSAGDKRVRKSLRRLASPFAAIVFNTAKTRAEVIDRLDVIRKQQRSLRVRLRPLEAKLETTRGGELDEAEARMSAALEQLAHRYQTKEAQDLRIHRILGAFKPAAALAELKPTATFDYVARRLLDHDAESTLAELHELKRGLPTTAEQDANIKHLFDL